MRTVHIFRTVALVLALGVVAGCTSSSSPSSSTTAGTSTSGGERTAAAQLPYTWVDYLTSTSKDQALSPNQAARFFAYTMFAMLEAGAPDSPAATSARKHLIEPVAIPAAPADLDGAIAANAAAGIVAANSILSPTARTAIAAFADERAKELAAGVDDDVAASSTAYGKAVAAKVVSWLKQDNYATNGSMSYSPPVGPGLWTPTPPAYALAVEPYWSKLRPMYTKPSACPVPAPPAYSDKEGSAFRDQVDAVYDTSQALTPDQRKLARVWDDLPGKTASPPGHWMRLVTAEAAKRKLDRPEATQLLAGVSAAMFDSTISTWNAKYRYNVVRPITEIRRLIDPTWNAVLVTPPHPSYPSGHSTMSPSAATVAQHVLGAHPFTDRTPAGFTPNRYASLMAAAEAAGKSREYGGIHYPMDHEAGETLGRCIGAATLEKIDLPKAAS